MTEYIIDSYINIKEYPNIFYDISKTLKNKSLNHKQPRKKNTLTKLFRKISLKK